MSIDRLVSIRDGYVKENEGVHLYSFVKKDPLKDSFLTCISNDRIRVAYMVLTQGNIKDILEDRNNNSAKIVLQKSIDKYKSFFEEVIKEESRDNRVKIEDLNISSKYINNSKLINTIRAPLYQGYSCYAEILKHYGYEYACEGYLSEKHKKERGNMNISFFAFSKDSCNSILKEELNKEELNSSEEAYIIISLPYVYNKVESSNQGLHKEYKAVYNLESITASFVPKVVVEYGLFFDGTNNSKYNIDFYQNYCKFVEDLVKYIKIGLEEKKEASEKQNNFKKADETDETQQTEEARRKDSVEHYILTNVDPKFDKNNKAKLIEQIKAANKEIIYYDGFEDFNMDKYDIKRSKQVEVDAKKIFDFLVEFKDVKKEIIIEQIAQDFVREEILNGVGESSSYLNAKTNIARLYEIYNGVDFTVKRDEPTISRFKAYQNGSGTNDVFYNRGYKKDSLIGLALGFGISGVVGNNLMMIKKMVEQLREDKYYYIDELVLDVFGFSRGATSARCFVNKLLEDTSLSSIEINRKYRVKPKNIDDIFKAFFEDYKAEELEFYFSPLDTQTEFRNIEYLKLGDKTETKIVKNENFGKPKIVIKSISIRFVGLFDTVTHYGIKQSNDYKEFPINLYKNRDKIGRVVHLMAINEYRYNFDTYSIFESVNKDIYKKDFNFEEFYVPGAHADVGGGYKESMNELVLLADITQHNSIVDEEEIKNSIKSWNSKYNWIPNSSIIKKIYNTKEIKESGFYYLIYEHINIYRIYIYMYREEMLNKYELVCGHIMYDKAVEKEKDKVPFSTYNCNFYEESDLNAVYEELNKYKNLMRENIELLNKIKYKYIHHSSCAGSFLINRPSYKQKEDDFYGKRSIYTSLGNEFFI